MRSLRAKQWRPWRTEDSDKVGIDIDDDSLTEQQNSDQSDVIV